MLAGSAFGFSSNFDYIGKFKHDEASNNLGFRIQQSRSGHRQVAHFTVSNVPITCSDNPASRSTNGYDFVGPMRVKHGQFAGKGDWTVILLDPAGSVSGTLKPGGTATGTLKLHGELAGSATHCHTGELEWKALKAA